VCGVKKKSVLHEAIFAHATAGELLAACLDADALAGGSETQPPGDAVLQEGDVLILKLDHAITIRADEVIVLRFVQEVGVVVGLIPPEVYLMQELALHEQAEGAVHRGPGDGGVHFPHTIQQFLRSKVVRGGKRRLHDGVSLLGAAETFADNEVVESVDYGRFHERRKPIL
jgi:hypothetical protein